MLMQHLPDSEGFLDLDSDAEMSCNRTEMQKNLDRSISIRNLMHMALK